MEPTETLGSAHWQARSDRISRRRLLSLSATGIGAAALASILAACGGSSSATTAPAAATTGGPGATKAPAAATTGGPAATTAPAAVASATSASASAVAPAASAATTAAAIQRGGTLVFGTAQQVESLDPHKGGLRNNRNAWKGLYSYLTQFDDKGLPAPFLAESWQVAPDNLSWTFAIRKGVKFHNGRGLTADDVKFTLDRVLAKETGSPLASQIQPVKQVEVIDPYSVKLSLSQPYGVLAAQLANVAIVAKENIDQIATKGIGSGPFKVKDYTAGQALELERFPDYWEQGADGKPLPYLDGVSIRTLADTNSLYTSLTTGTVQAFWQMPDQIQVQAEKVSQLQLVPSKFKTTYDEYLFQADKPPFDNKDLRMSLLLALDKQAIAEAGYFGHADPRPNNNIIPPGSWAEKTGIPDIKRDPARAKQLFDQAGVKNLKFLGYNETPQFKPISQIMERNLNEIGIKLELIFTDLTTWKARIRAGSQTEAWGNGDDGNAFTVNISVNPPDPSVPLASWGCHTHPITHFCDESLKKAADMGAQSADQGARKDAYATYQDIWQQDIPAIITCFRPFTHAAQKKVHGLYDDDGALIYRLAWMEK